MSVFHPRSSLEITEGDFDVPVNSRNIISIKGARRVEKTYFLYYLMSNLIDMIGRKNLLFNILTKRKLRR